MDPNIREAKIDGIIIKLLPYLVLACIFGGIANILINIASNSPWMFVVRFCEPFVAGFMIFGILGFLTAGKNIVKNRLPMVLFATGPLMVAAVAFILGETAMPDIFGSTLFERNGDLPADILMSAVKIYAIMAAVILVVYGIECVVSAHFRQNIAKVYHYIGKLKNDGTDDRKGRFTLMLYGVPDIIDIRSVELEPFDRDSFPFNDFVSMTVNVFALGLIVSSYIFLNPVFAREMAIYESMMIGIVISLFIPLLILPWHITRETGTKIKSQARDLYLWKGMKKHMYQSFFAFTMVLFLILMTIYFESDMVRITYTYIGYVTFLIFTSMIYSYVFFSRYNIGLREGIIRKFNECQK